MAQGMWIAASGAQAASQKLETIANNIANANATAYKKDIDTFKEYLTAYEHPKLSLDIPAGPVKDAHFYPLDDRDASYVIADGTYTLFEPGTMISTSRPLDVALPEKGFFEVLTPNGVRYTRNGSFNLRSDGVLVNGNGHPVLSASDDETANPASRLIEVEANGPLVISEKGEIFVGQEPVGLLSVIDVKDAKFLMKEGASLFKNLKENNVVKVNDPVVQQGYLEGSNVNVIEEMTRLIEANRAFEHDLKALKTYHQMMGREANDIGRL
jgi:flagellar basal-body rod protein FlgF